MGTVTFNLIMESNLINNEEDAFNALYSMMSIPVSFDFEYEYDRDFVGEIDGAFTYKVSVDVENKEDAWEFIEQKFEMNTPRGVYLEIVEAE